MPLERKEPSWEARHEEGIELTQRRIDDHHEDYNKPLPTRWWLWHCEICNAPIEDRVT